MAKKETETWDQYYARIGVKPATEKTVVVRGCPDCAAKGKESHLVSHRAGKSIERKRNWPKGCNYFFCSNCSQPLFVVIEDFG
jgi:hypothetical protein